jgi:two-component system chemotaxis response regulator CheY
MLKSIGSLLELEHSCILASDGAHALDYYIRNRPALVVLDLAMPGMTGSEVAERIIEIDPDARIVVFSVLEKVAEIVKLFRIGIRDYLVKPCDGDRLLHAVNDNLRDEENCELVVTDTLLSVRRELREILEKGDIPVLFGPCGTGKRTELREAMKDRGVKSPVVAGPLPRLGTRTWVNSGFRFCPSETGGFVFWAKWKKWNAQSAEDIAKWRRESQEAPPRAEVPGLGITWDNLNTGSGSGLPSHAPFVPVRMPSISERAEEVGTIIDHFRRRLNPNSIPWSAEDSSRLGDFLRKHPRLANMRLLKALAKGPELWEHFRAREFP